jgi:hypothetical protein
MSVNSLCDHPRAAGLKQTTSPMFNTCNSHIDEALNAAKFCPYVNYAAQSQWLGIFELRQHVEFGQICLYYR